MDSGNDSEDDLKDYEDCFEHDDLQICNEETEVLAIND